MMKISFRKLSNERHLFQVVRADQSSESVELETRSLLFHDLVHYAVEGEAKLSRGFFGLLAAGLSLDVINASISDGMIPSPEDPRFGELGLVETLVGPMQSCFNGQLSQERYRELLQERAPKIIRGDFVDGVFERLRRLTGHWRATAFGQAMELCWPPDDWDG